MRKTLLLGFLLAGSLASKATIHNVTTSGFTFTPFTVSATVGDTVRFTLAGLHNATEVAVGTWAVNGTTPLAGGFALSAPGGDVILTSAGTRYYICTTHATSSMKGQINVVASSVNENTLDFSTAVYPNPAVDYLQIELNSSSEASVKLEVYNLFGSKVMNLDQTSIAGSFNKRFDISTLQRGIYFLNIVSGNNRKSIKFVKK